MGLSPELLAVRRRRYPAERTKRFSVRRARPLRCAELVRQESMCHRSNKGCHYSTVSSSSETELQLPGLRVESIVGSWRTTRILGASIPA